MFIRFLLTVAIVYFGYKFFKGLWAKQTQRDEVRGRARNEPLDLRDKDIDDAHFEDIEEKDKS